MATESLKATHGYKSVIRNAFLPPEHLTEIVRLSVGANTAKVGHLVSYVGQVTASQPNTHRDVTLATKNTAGYDALVSNTFAGIILSPCPAPSETWDIDDALVDGTYVKILRPTGGQAKVSIFVTDPSADLLPSQRLSIDTAGRARKTVVTMTVTTPTVTELADALISLWEQVGIVADVAEDVAGTDLVVNIWF